MKRIVLLFFVCACWLTGLSQNNKLRGIVKLQSSGAQALANVQISAFGAGTVYSNDRGMFEMTFNGKQPGSAVSLLVQLDGYELINEKELEQCVLRKDPDDLLFVIMARQGERNKQALAYYNIIIGTTQNNYKNELSAIKSRLEGLNEGDKERGILLEQIATLQQEKESLLNRAEALAKQLATVDLDRTSGMARAAYEQFERGDIKAALAVLDDQDLAEQLKDAQEKKVQLTQQLVMADSALQQGIENYMIKARFCIADQQYGEAYQYYLKAVDADTTRLDNIWELADYCNTLNQQKRAIRYYQRALALTTSPRAQASILRSLGNQYCYDDDYPKAEQAYMKSLEIYQQQVALDPESFYPGLASLQNSLGNMHADLRNYRKAVTAYNEALKIRQQLAATDPQGFQPELAEVTGNLGGLYADFKEFDQAEKAYLESLAMYEDLARIDPSRFERRVALTQENVGRLYLSLGHFQKAESAFLAALDIFKKLAAKNPDRYEANLANVQSLLGANHLDQKEFSKAEGYYQAALEVFQRLAEENPRRYERNLAYALEDMAVLYAMQEDYPRAKNIFLQILEVYQRLTVQNPQRYEPDVAGAYLNLGIINKNLKAFDQSEAAYHNVLEIFRRLAKENPQRFTLDLCYPLVNLGFLKQAQLQEELEMKYREEGLSHIAEAIDILSASDSTLRLVKFLLPEALQLQEYFTSISREELFVDQECQKLATLAAAIQAEMEPSSKVNHQLKVVELLELALDEYPHNDTLVGRKSEADLHLVKYHLLAGQFETAEELAQQPIKLNDEKQQQLTSYLMLSWLYQGKVNKAKKLYLKMKDQPTANGSFGDLMLHDLSELEHAGLTHEDASVIRKL